MGASLACAAASDCGEVLLRGLHRAGECGEVAETAGLLREFLLVALDVGDFLVEPRQPVAMAADAGLELVALGGEVGERVVSSVNRRSVAASVASASDTRSSTPERFSTRDLISSFSSASSVSSRCSATSASDGLLLLARDVGGKLRQPAVELGDALLGALFLAVERFARIGEPLQSGRGAGFGLAQRRQFGGADRLDARGLGLLAGTFGHLANGEVMGMGGIVDVGMGLDPAQMVQRRLGLAHLGGDFAVADRLPRLFLQAVDLSGELADHVLDAGEVGFGSLSRSSASWRRACSPATPAASSSTRRRCSGFA